MFGGLLERYKNLPMVARAVLAIILALLPAVIVYTSFIEDKEIERDLALKNHDAARASLKKTEDTVKNIPDLEKKMKFTEEQLNKAKEFLPDNYDMEGVVEKASRIAKQLDVTLDHFEPKSEKMIEGAYSYVEQRIALDLAGSYAQIATFFDLLANIEPNVYLKTLTLNRQTATASRAAPGKEDAYEQARALRRDQKLFAKSEISVYRSAKASEIRQAKPEPVKKEAKPPELKPEVAK